MHRQRSQPGITTVIPTYGRATLLRRAIRSVLQQDYPAASVIVCDNASQDRTEAVVRNMMEDDARITYHRHPANIGAIANFQYAIEQVQTPWFTILSDDDMLLPGFFQRIAAASANNAAIGFYCGGTVIFSEDSGTHRVRPRAEWRDGMHEAKRWAGRMFREHFTWTGCAFSREVRDAVGRLDPVPMMDVLYLVKAAARFAFLVDRRPGAIFTARAGTVSQSATFEHLAANYAACQTLAQSLHSAGMDNGDLDNEIRTAFRYMGNAMLRRAFQTNDRELVARSAEFLSDIGELSARRRVAALAARCSIGAWLMYHSAHWQSRMRQAKAGGLRPTSIGEVLRNYAGADYAAAVLAGDGTSVDAEVQDAGRRLL